MAARARRRPDEAAGSTSFGKLADEARALLRRSVLQTAPIEAFADAADGLGAEVPSERRDDWARLIAGLRRPEGVGRRRARLAGVIRACRLFAPSPAALEPIDPASLPPIDLDATVDVLDGLGPAAARVLATQGVRSVGDLLQTLPTGLVDLRAPLEGAAVLEAARAVQRRAVAIKGVVERASVIPMRGRRAVRVAMRSGEVPVELWWFFLFAGARSLRGECIAVGIPALTDKRPGVVRLAHPRLVAAARLGAIEPIYTFSGLSSVRVAQAIAAVLPRVDVAPLDPMPPEVRARDGRSPIDSVLRGVHAPTTPEEHDAMRLEMRARLAWAEACWLVLRRIEREKLVGGARATRLPVARSVRERFVRALGFAPTGAQQRAIESIGKQLEAERPARILLTGDVGTGKTAVLLAAAAQALAAGKQVAILAPTTILAEQYLDAAGPLAIATDARIALLPRNAASDRAVHARVSRSAARGDVDVVIGTHALLGEGVRFARLGLVIVDEQHRLGVAQRLALVAKSEGGAAGSAPHLLTVSATPIPRTLALALRGEISTVHLDERPPGRRTPDTSIAPREAWPGIVEDLRTTAARGESAYVVCSSIDPPTLEDGTPDDGASPGAVARFEELSKALGAGNVALVHGGLGEIERRAALALYRRGEVKILVGTTMLEVGVDVAAATLIVIDGADRFGLAQVHQLRGRVGRGERPGRCVLVHGEPIGALARARLEAICAATDGLEVARADLRLRGPGDLEGARQSGEAAGFRFLDPLGDEALIAAAAEDIARIAATPGALQSAGHAGLRRALARFDADAAARELGIARGEAG